MPAQEYGLRSCGYFLAFLRDAKRNSSAQFNYGAAEGAKRGKITTYNSTA